MPTRRETDATEALIGLNNNLQPYASIQDDDVSDLVLEGDEAVHHIDPTVVGNYIELPMFEAERFFGSTVKSSSTSTPADTPSDESQEQPSNILPHGSGTLLDKKRASKRNTKSGIWKFFEIYKDPKIQNMAFCLLCKKDVNYTFTMSTGMLTRHIRSKHRFEYQAMLEEEISKKSRPNTASKSNDVKVQSSIDKFVEVCSGFDKTLTDWVIQTYQPLHACQHPSFRAMCHSLNLKAPIIGLYKMQSLLSTEAACARVKLRSILKGIDVCLTTDAWTSCNNVTFITCTAHFVHPKTWVLHHFPLGLFKKEGTSLAEDVVRHVENIWDDYQIEHSKITCVVTDTEATMVKAARIFARHAQQDGTEFSWHGCVDHVLNLVTKLAFTDFNGSEGVMHAARDLVGYFSSSSQAEAVLLSKQIPGSAVKCIQDVTTRWWSAYSMCERLLRLRPYFSLIEAEGVLKKNLNEAQWQIVKDTTAVLEPFTCAQRLLEGESYVTVSMIAFII